MLIRITNGKKSQEDPVYVYRYIKISDIIIIIGDKCIRYIYI